MQLKRDFKGESGPNIGYWILDDKGKPKPADLVEWAAWFESKPLAACLAQTQIGTWTVSTIFLGMDPASLYPTAHPVLWESMFFTPKDSECQRYRSMENAMHGHDELVAKARRLWIEKYKREPLVKDAKGKPIPALREKMKIFRKEK